MKILLDSPHRGRNNRRPDDIRVEVLLDGVLTQLVGGHQPLPLLLLTCQCSNLVSLKNNSTFRQKLANSKP